jgi:hypothetical protein
MRDQKHAIVVLVQNGNGSVSSLMSSTAGQRGSPSDRVRRQAETRALVEARTVPWRLVADAAAEYTEWQVFALWLRAVLDACEGLPALVALKIETRSPVLLSRIASALGNTVSSRGSMVWEDITNWAESNVFARAKRDRWLNAIRHFSSRSLLSMKAWAYWENINLLWRDEKPETLPTYEQWMSATAAVSRLSNPESDAQQVLDSIRLIPEAKWQQMFAAFMELATICLWIEILLEAGGTGAEVVARELTARYPRFDTSAVLNSGDAISTLMDWVIAHEPSFASSKPPLLALNYHIKCHPAYYARRNYAAHCRDAWRLGHFERLPSLAEWRDAADGFFER